MYLPPFEYLTPYACIVWIKYLRTGDGCVWSGVPKLQ